MNVARALRNAKSVYVSGLQSMKLEGEYHDSTMRFQALEVICFEALFILFRIVWLIKLFFTKNNIQFLKINYKELLKAMRFIALEVFCFQVLFFFRIVRLIKIFFTKNNIQLLKLNYKNCHEFEPVMELWNQCII